MRVACEELNQDFGIKLLRGSIRDVSYTLRLGALNVTVDWSNTTGNGHTLTSADIKDSGVLKLAAAVARAAGVWYNLTQDKECFDIATPFHQDDDHSSTDDDATGAIATGATTSGEKHRTHWQPAPRRLSTAASTNSTTSRSSTAAVPTCPACPPCDDCPPCPVSYCDWEDTEPCTYCRELSKTFSWEGIGCNEALSQVGRMIHVLSPFTTTNDALSQIDIKGVGRDIYWPPQVRQIVCQIVSQIVCQIVC
jgi:hypothetical protein